MKLCRNDETPVKLYGGFKPALVDQNPGRYPPTRHNQHNGPDFTIFPLLLQENVKTNMCIYRGNCTFLGVFVCARVCVCVMLFWRPIRTNSKP